MAKSADRMEKIVALCKRRGFIFQSSEIYGGINGFGDFGLRGAELTRDDGRALIDDPAIGECCGMGL